MSISRKSYHNNPFNTVLDNDNITTHYLNAPHLYSHLFERYASSYNCTKNPLKVLDARWDVSLSHDHPEESTTTAANSITTLPPLTTQQSTAIDTLITTACTQGFIETITTLVLNNAGALNKSHLQIAIEASQLAITIQLFSYLSPFSTTKTSHQITPRKLWKLCAGTNNIEMIQWALSQPEIKSFIDQNPTQTTTKLLSSLRPTATYALTIQYPDHHILDHFRQTIEVMKNQDNLCELQQEWITPIMDSNHLPTITFWTDLLQIPTPSLPFITPTYGKMRLPAWQYALYKGKCISFLAAFPNNTTPCQCPGNNSHNGYHSCIQQEALGIFLERLGRYGQRHAVVVWDALCQVDSIRAFIDKARCTRGYTPLQHAMLRRDVGLCRAMIGAGADLEYNCGLGTFNRVQGSPVFNFNLVVNNNAIDGIANSQSDGAFYLWLLERDQIAGWVNMYDVLTDSINNSNGPSSIISTIKTNNHNNQLVVDNDGEIIPYWESGIETVEGSMLGVSGGGSGDGGGGSGGSLGKMINHHFAKTGHNNYRNKLINPLLLLTTLLGSSSESEQVLGSIVHQVPFNWNGQEEGQQQQQQQQQQSQSTSNNNSSPTTAPPFQYYRPTTSSPSSPLQIITCHPQVDLTSTVRHNNGIGEFGGVNWFNRYYPSHYNLTMLAVHYDLPDNVYNICNGVVERLMMYGSDDMGCGGGGTANGGGNINNGQWMKPFTLTNIPTQQTHHHLVSDIHISHDDKTLPILSLETIPSSSSPPPLPSPSSPSSSIPPLLPLPSTTPRANSQTLSPSTVDPTTPPTAPPIIKLLKSVQTMRRGSVMTADMPDTILPQPRLTNRLTVSLSHLLGESFYKAVHGDELGTRRIDGAGEGGDNQCGQQATTAHPDGGGVNGKVVLLIILAMFFATLAIMIKKLSG